MNARCGNLFIEHDEFAAQVIGEARHMCARERIFEDLELRQMMLSADEIWFASAWHYWQAGFIEKSVANVVIHSKKPVKVFGTKNFSKVDIKHLLSIAAPQRVEINATVSAVNIETNALLKRSLHADVFIDVQGLICGTNASSCALFSKGGQLLSYDGGHLTRFGARHLGDKLSGIELLKDIANAKRM